MINLLLNDLQYPAGEVFHMYSTLQGLIVHLNGLITFTLTMITEKQQTAFRGVTHAILLTLPAQQRPTKSVIIALYNAIASNTSNPELNEKNASFTVEYRILIFSIIFVIIVFIIA